MTLRRPKCPNEPRAASEKSLSRTRVNARYVPVAPRTFSLPRALVPLLAAARRRTLAGRFSSQRLCQRPPPRQKDRLPDRTARATIRLHVPRRPLGCSRLPYLQAPYPRIAQPSRSASSPSASRSGERASSNWVLARGAPSTSSPATARGSSSETPPRRRMPRDIGDWLGHLEGSNLVLCPWMNEQVPGWFTQALERRAAAAPDGSSATACLISTRTCGSAESTPDR